MQALVEIVPNTNGDAKFQIFYGEYFLDKRKKIRRGQTQKDLQCYWHVSLL